MTSPTSRPLATVSCIVRAGDEPRQVAIEQAVSLAAGGKSHLVVTSIGASTATVYTPLWSGMTAALIEDENRRAKEQAEAVAKVATKAAADSGVDIDVYVSEGPINPTAHAAVAAASASDVVIVDQIAAVMDLRGVILEEALFHSGRPVLVASPHAKVGAEPRRIMVAWDGSSHSARAAADALALFPSVTDVEIVSVSGEKDLAKSLPGADFARHVDRKGKAATVSMMPVGRAHVADILQDKAASSGSELIVMGGYGHSRFRQFIFGGVTLSLVQGSKLPLLMAY